ncbi:hypothetical protein A5740_19215 [Mycobacterium sp. GA-1841]|nr:hypothetical protein A5740_19215 [Mycobacterium sp. GA-1841]
MSVRVVPDSDGFRQKAQRQLDRETDGVEAEVRVTPDLSRFRERIRAATHNLEADVRLNVDRSSIDRFQRLAAVAVNNVRAPQVSAPSMPRTGLPQADLAVMAAAVSAALLAVGPAVGVLTGALLTLPGLITAVAVPVGALALGMDGLKKAAERLKTPFEDLKATMSRAVESQFGPVFDKLGSVFPMLASALPKVTQGMADLAQSVVDTITSSGGMAKIEGIISNIGTALSTAAPGVGSFTNGLLTLAEKLSTKLPGIATWFNDVGTKFDAWITQMNDNGKLDKIFDGLGTLFSSVGTALGTIMDKGLDFFDNPEAVERWAVAIEKIGAGLGAIISASNAMSNSGFTFGIVGMHDEIENQGGYGKVFEGFKETNAKLWETVKSAASGAWDWITTNTSTAWEAIKNAVSTGIDGVVSFVQGLPGRITAAIGDLSGTLVAAGKSLMDGLLKGITSAWESVKSFVSGIAGWIADHKGPLPYDKKVLVPNGQALMEGLQAGLTSGFEPVLAKAKSMAQQISEAMSNGTNVADLLGGKKLPGLTQMLDELAAERKTLRVQLDSTPDKESRRQIRDKMSQLQAETNLLSLQKQQLDNAKKYGGELADQASASEDWASKFTDVGINFARATGDQAMADLGIGGGAITGIGNALLDYGIGMAKKAVTGSSIVYNVGNVDDAIALDRRNRNREAIQWEK